MPDQLALHALDAGPAGVAHQLGDVQVDGHGASPSSASSRAAVLSMLRAAA